MKQADLKIQINNQTVDFPLEAFDLKVTTNYENDNIQASSTEIDDLTIYGDGVDIVNTWVNTGKYYKGIPLNISTVNDTGQRSTFNGYINLPKKHEIFQDGTLKVGVSKRNDLTNLNDRLASITWALLDDNGEVTQSDYVKIDYVVEKSDNSLELLITTLTLFIMTKELIESIKSTIDNINKITTGSIPTVGVPPSITIGAIIYATLSVILQLLYISLILIAIINMANRLFDLIIQPKRQHRVLNYRRGMQILARHLGLNFVSPISELDYYHYLPSNIEVDGIDLGIGTINVTRGVSKGIPKANDYGYTGLEFTSLLLTQFEAKIAVVGSDLVMRAKNDPYWTTQSTYVLPDIDVLSYENNAKDIVFSTLIKYETDAIADEYTLSNFLGTNYQVLVNDSNVSQGADDNFIKKHETINFNLALGTRKDKLNPLEKTLKTLGGFIDALTFIFGGGTSLAQRVQTRIGALKVGTNNHNKAKCLYLVGGQIPTNHRNFTSAKYLYHKYINDRSFVLNNFGKQKNIYRVSNIPFGMNDYLQTVDNSYIRTSNNDVAKITFSEWNILNDTNEIVYEKKNVYAPNLSEYYIEQN